MAKAWRRLTRSSTQSFNRFFDLPRELRDEIYEFYFCGFTGLSSCHQPHSPLAATILAANRQLHDEAKAIMLKRAVFTISLHPKHSKFPGRDIVYWLDHHLWAGELFNGRRDVFKQFKNVSELLTRLRR